MARLLRNLVLASIATGAVLGIVTLLGADVGDTGAKIIGTSFSVTGAALLAMPAAAAWERKQLGPLPAVGIASAVAGFAWLIVGMWIEYGTDWLWKAPATLIVVAVAVAVVALLDMAKLASPHRWVLTAARISTAVVAAMVVIGMWSELDSDAYWRVFGVAAVLLAAFLAATPILHRSSRTAVGVARYCPMCGTAHEAPTGVETSCPACEHAYRVLI